MNYTKWCKFKGISLISVLQKSFETVDEKRSTVLLIRDKDGIFKILKEVYDYKKYLPNYLNEDEIYERLSGAHQSLIPPCYGTVDIDGQKFIKISFIYGQPLADYCRPDNLLAPEDVSFVIGMIAKKLEGFRINQLLYLDLKPENILVSIDAVHLIDFGLSQFNYEPDLMGIITHPRYTAPETIFTRVSEKSIVFQLGIIAQELLTGKHPFDKTPDEPRTMDWCRSAQRHFSVLGIEAEVRGEFISKMLKVNPAERPTLQMCLKNFTFENEQPIKRKGVRSSSDKYVLFPARMGIPHKGHIEYMSRILDLGYKLIISIQRSYTITDRDPIPKWLVMKMVAQSLLNLGYSKESFKIFLTPFYKTDRELRMHFATMPRIEKVITVASSNSDVHALFPNMEMPIIEQQHVFCTEYDGGSEFIPKSWGEIIRNAVKNDDYKTFQQYVAGGVERILSFEEIRAMYGRPAIEFVPGIVIAALTVTGDPILTTRVSKYLTPEESLIQEINNTDDVCKMIDPYSKNSVVRWNDDMVQLSYTKTEFKDDNEIIYFDLLK